jgi:two-component sensor histidine kinase
VFWIGFTAGWGVYFGISFFFGAAEGGLGWAFRIAAVNALPPALLAVPVALARDRLFRPGMRAGPAVLLHVGVGLTYAVSVAFALVLVTDYTGITMGELGDASFGKKVLLVSVSASFLYVVFSGVIAWTESLRQVHESQRVAAREAVLRAEAEAKAVRAQFNPHFVFNTLHSLMLLVRADPEAAERAIEDVATLIRYASIVQRRDLDVVPLSKELEVARRYVALERLRLGDRLEVAWNVDVDPARLTVPAFALQTLVENAIKHGIEPKPGGGHVGVDARADGGRLVLRVSDDGVGARSDSVAGRSGHGLELLAKRLERYGDEAEIEWETAPGEGFDVWVRIPAEEPASEPALDVIEGRTEAVGVDV